MLGWAEDFMLRKRVEKSCPSPTKIDPFLHPHISFRDSLILFSLLSIVGWFLKDVFYCYLGQLKCLVNFALPCLGGLNHLLGTHNTQMVFAGTSGN